MIIGCAGSLECGLPIVSATRNRVLVQAIAELSGKFSIGRSFNGEQSSRRQGGVSCPPSCGIVVLIQVVHSRVPFTTGVMRRCSAFRGRRAVKSCSPREEFMKSALALFVAGLIVSSAWPFGLASSGREARAPGMAKQDDDSVQGTWLPATAELGGKAFPDEIRKTIKLVIKEELYTVTVGENTDRGTLKLNPSAEPKELDITGIEGPNRGRTILAIYERDGDTLQVCYDLSGKDRPKEFSTRPGTQLFLVTYRLERP